MSYTAHDLPQGSAQWDAHRREHLNASEAAALLGLSPYMTRSELLAQKATGVAPEVGAAKQRIFDNGHTYEAQAQPWAEAILGEDLYAITATRIVEGLPLGASFDGLTLDDSTVWEHKTLSLDLAASLARGEIPEHHRPQLEQQLLISGAKRVMFMASAGDKNNAPYVFYESDPALRARLIAAWKQFSIDLADYRPPTEVLATIVAAPVTALPAVSVQVSGQIVIADNFKAFETALRDFIEHRLIREPSTDQDFADLDLQIKALKDAEAALDSAEAQMLAQVDTVDSAKRTKDMLLKLARDNRLMAEKLLEAKKQAVRSGIVVAGSAAFAAHINALNTRLGRPCMPIVPADFAGAVKNKRTIASLQDAVDAELARAKIAANEIADRIDVNLRYLRENADQHKALFPDTSTIVLKAADDLQSLVKARIAEHKAAEERREAETRERIRAEEQQRADREARERLAAEQRAEAQRQADAAAAAKPAPAADAGIPISAPAVTAQAPAPAPQVVQMPARAPAAAGPVATLRLGQICDRLGFTVTAEFLRTLTFEPCGRERSAVLYRADEFPYICAALVQHINKVSQPMAVAA